jgi:hypothetical protein
MIKNIVCPKTGLNVIVCYSDARLIQPILKRFSKFLWLKWLEFVQEHSHAFKTPKFQCLHGRKDDFQPISLANISLSIQAAKFQVNLTVCSDFNA